MKTLFISLLYIFLTQHAFSKGCSGAYKLIGVAKDSKNEIIRNGTFLVKHRGVIDTVKTDENGLYGIKISWSTVCPSTSSIFKWNKTLNEQNPKFFTIIYDQKEYKIKNRWRRYSSCFFVDPEKNTRNKNLKFNKEKMLLRACWDCGIFIFNTGNHCFAEYEAGETSVSHPNLIYEIKNG